MEILPPKLLKEMMYGVMFTMIPKDKGTKRK